MKWIAPAVLVVPVLAACGGSTSQGAPPMATYPPPGAAAQPQPQPQPQPHAGAPGAPRAGPFRVEAQNTCLTDGNQLVVFAVLEHRETSAGASQPDIIDRVQGSHHERDCVATGTAFIPDTRICLPQPRVGTSHSAAAHRSERS